MTRQSYPVWPPRGTPRTRQAPPAPTTSAAPTPTPTPRPTFRRDRLPDPARYFAEADLKLKGRGAWRTGLCPFHEDHRPSFSVNVETGYHVCFSCGARGGDVLDFHRRRHGLDFLAAARDLGALV